MLFGRSWKSFNPDQGGNETIPSKNVHNIINHFWDRWRTEYLVNLRECQIKYDNRQVISVGDVVLIEEDKLPRFCWRMGLVGSLIYGKDEAARGTVVRVSKTCREISRAVNKLYPVEGFENNKKEMNDASETIAAVIGDINGRFVAEEC